MESLSPLKPANLKNLKNIKQFFILQLWPFVILGAKNARTSISQAPYRITLRLILGLYSMYKGPGCSTKTETRQNFPYLFLRLKQTPVFPAFPPPSSSGLSITKAHQLTAPCSLQFTGNTTVILIYRCFSLTPPSANDLPCHVHFGQCQD